MQYPVTISNIHGEVLIFTGLSVNEKGEQVLLVENEVKPRSGPPMHTHFKQDESLTVVTGLLGYQLQGGKEQFAKPGETIIFYRGTPHKFWNAGTDMLRCKGWVSPPNTLVYFLGEIYKSINQNNGRPGMFDAAYLLNRYKGEYAMNDIPGFVQSVIFPIALFFGKITGKHKKFADAPQPV
jgi:quercetin dioxygenase-like cupin family protein